MADIPVLVVDDQAPFRVAARAVIARAQGFSFVGEVDGGEGVADAVAALRPQLVLMDVNMGAVDGIEATRRALAVDPDLSVFLCSTYPLDELPAGARTCGARGYVRKEDLSPEMLRRLWAGRDGEGWPA